MLITDCAMPSTLIEPIDTKGWGKKNDCPLKKKNNKAMTVDVQNSKIGLVHVAEWLSD